MVLETNVERLLPHQSQTVKQMYQRKPGISLIFYSTLQTPDSLSHGGIPQKYRISVRKPPLLLQNNNPEIFGFNIALRNNHVIVELLT